MVWIIAIACLCLFALVGYSIGPVRAGFSLLGLLFGAMLAKPLAPLTERLLPLIGLQHPIWRYFIPEVIGFVVVLVVFVIAGGVVHHKILVHFKYDKEDFGDVQFLRWLRLYARLGLCVGLLNGAVYFLILMAPIYIAGYFLQEAVQDADNVPATAKFVAHTREDLHGLGLDRILAAYDPLPNQIYEAADIVDLILHNPQLQGRLVHYPPFLTLAQRPDFQALAADQELHRMLETGASVAAILQYPAVHQMLIDPGVTGDVYALLGGDATGLSDLQHYLLTGQSDKFDSEPILGSWHINPVAVYAWARRRSPGLTPLQFARERMRLSSFVPGLSFVATVNNQVILKKGDPGDPDAPGAAVATGEWTKDGDDYIIDLPGSLPEKAELEFDGPQRLLLPKDGDILVFDKD